MIIQDNILFNDFAGSGRTNTNSRGVLFWLKTVMVTAMA